MRMRFAHVVFPVVALTLSACAGPRTAPAPGSGVRSGQAVVVGGDELWNRGGELLGLVAARIANMRIQRSSGCPTITIRGNSRLQGPSNPRIYVDGQTAVDTCILQVLRPDDVERVEVYPMGVTNRPGYLSHPHGLILVFTRSQE